VTTLDRRTEPQLDPVRLARLVSGAVVVEMPFAVLAVSGPGALQCLQGLITNDLVTPGPDTITWGALLTPKGMIESDLWALRHGDDVTLLIPTAGKEKVAEVFRRSLPPRLAKVTDQSGTHRVLFLYGSGAEGALHGTPTVPLLGQVVAEPDGTLLAHPPVGAPAPFILVAPEPALAPRRARLHAHGASEGDGDDAEGARILAGWPALGAEIDEKTLPQEVRFDELGGVSYTKGCYLGQETVARLHFRGHPNRELRGLEWEDAAPLAGDGIEGAGRPAGTIRSTLLVGGRRVGLAPIRREVATGDAVVAGGRPARVVALPFEGPRVA
jgi:folate-binding protein YgfZ